MKPRCKTHHRPMRWVARAGVWWCRVYGCGEFSTLPAPEKKDLFPDHQRRAGARPPCKRKPLQYRGRKSTTRVTKGGRVVLGRAEYVALCRLIWDRDGGRCTIEHKGCWGKLPYFSTRWVDHRIKRSQMGSDTEENCRLACPSCHDWADSGGGKISRKEEARQNVLDRQNRAS